jgi:hypothetical protein
MLVKRISFPGLREKYRIYAVCNAQGKCQLEKFLASLSSSKKETRDRDKIFADMRMAAEHGPRRIPTKRCHFMEQPHSIYEFTGGTGQVRIGWFYDEGCIIICTHGFVKKKQTTPDSEKKKAITAQKEYFKAKSDKTLKHINPDDKGEGK